MKINREGVSLLDNDNEYIDFIGSAIKLADPESILNVVKGKDKLHFTITLSNPEFKEHLIECILDIHNRLKIKIHFSSSLKISKKVYFYLDI